MTTTYHHSAAFNDLAALLRQLFLPQAADYEQVRQLWNGGEDTTRCDRSLSHCTRCHSYRSLDRTWATPLGSSGGHDTAGRALSEGVVIDLSQMKSCTVDPDQRTAHVQVEQRSVI